MGCWKTRRWQAIWTTCANLFEKKLHDLEFTRASLIQMAQIRLVQSTTIHDDRKIQSTLAHHDSAVEEPDGAGAGTGAFL